MTYEDNSQSSQNQHQDPPTTPTDEDILSQALQFINHVPPPDYTPPKLSRPIAVPQTIAGMGQPFARVYAPALSYHKINSQDFIEFIDNLNVVATANPPLQIVDLVGGVIGMVPYHWTQLASAGISALAKAGQVAVSKSRTDIYMKNVNAKFFGPRGLKASITSMEALATVLQLPANTSGLAPVTGENMDTTVLQRRMEVIEPFVMEMTFDVPRPAPQTTTLAKMSARQVKRQIIRNDKKAQKEREKHLEDMRKEQDKREDKKDNDKRERKIEKEVQKVEKEMRKVDKEVDETQRELQDLRVKESGKKLRKEEEKLEKEMRKLEKEKGKLEHELDEVYEKGNEGGKERDDGKKKEKRESKEEKKSKKALWILIENI